MKFVISDTALITRVGGASWLLAQVFWVGAVWALPLLVMPALLLSGLAPLLVSYVLQLLAGCVAVVIIAGALIQGFVLIAALGLRAWVTDRRGKLLQMTLLLTLIYALLLRWMPDALYAQVAVYALVAFSGLRLVVQPTPAIQRQSK